VPRVEVARPATAGAAFSRARDLLAAWLANTATLDELARAARLRRFAFLRGFARTSAFHPTPG